MNKLAIKSESVNKELTNNKKYYVSYDKLINRIKCSQSPATFFNHHANYINYLQFRSGKDLGFSREQNKCLAEIFSYGFDQYFALNFLQLKQRYAGYIPKKKESKPEYDEKHFHPEFKQIAKRHGMPLKMAKIVHEICLRLHKGKDIYQRETAGRSKACRQYTNECVQKLIDKGLLRIVWSKRGHINKYEISDELRKFFRECFDKHQYTKKRNAVKKISLEALFQKDDTTINTKKYIRKDSDFNREIENKILYWCPKYRPIIFEERRKRKDFKDLLPNYLFCSPGAEKPRDSRIDFYRNNY
jgi:hypothetical protein